ncbi:hypothetical protein [Alkalinema sp. FACHB-956]|uniref:hypothetical protein n=1 Tax=Alkalinema sp. FACHB-956 TaxID=2692768 RepID=UPI00168601FB|nr:hypothetical protein [Alkalinema sp. FACHB-956]MBD2329421.1 hypothetical protein [Alkalinema sp. FACHB-956]
MSTPLLTFQSSQVTQESNPGFLLTVGEQKRSGLILCKEFHAEFAGPGAAVACASEQPYQAVIAIGAPSLVPVQDWESRRKAYGLRIQWERWLHKIADHPDPTSRVERLFAGLEGFFGRQVVMSLPTEVLSLLVGVLPSTVETVRRRQGHPTRFDTTTVIFPSEQLQITTLNLETITTQGHANQMPLGRNLTLQEIHRVYEKLQSA